MIDARFCLVQGLVAKRSEPDMRRELARLVRDCDWHYGKLSRRYVDAIGLTIEMLDPGQDITARIRTIRDWLTAAAVVLVDSDPRLVRGRRMLWALLTNSSSADVQSALSGASALGECSLGQDDP
jgi:hypothetical protein